MNIKIYDESDLVVNVEVEYCAGSQACRDEFGRPETPDDEDEINILDAVGHFGYSINLTGAQEDEVINAATERIRSEFEDERY